LVVVLAEDIVAPCVGLVWLEVSESAAFGNEALGFGFCDSCGLFVGWNRKAAANEMSNFDQSGIISCEIYQDLYAVS
jgi:hypothetical protein